MGLYAVLLASGASERMGGDKLSMTFGGKTPVELSLEAFRASGCPFDQIVLTASQRNYDALCALAARYKNVAVTHGGATRGESVLNALRTLSSMRGVVAIHDSARCLVPPETVREAVLSAQEFGSGVAAVPARDTVRRADGGEVAREGLFAMQTPQAFDLEGILKAYEAAFARGETLTDDAAAYIAAGHAVRYTGGKLINQKLTFGDDVSFFNAAAGAVLRTGYGVDTHALAKGRKLVIGGVEIPFDRGLDGHSDADVLIHAVMDALLGAAAMGDIGALFPPSDARYLGIASTVLLGDVGARLRAEGWEIVNIDSTVIAERPKMAPHIPQMRRIMAETLKIAPESVSVKATTTEGMNDEGRGLCISAQAVCLIQRK